MLIAQRQTFKFLKRVVTFRDHTLEIVRKLTYLDVVFFTVVVSSNMAFETLSGQALKALYKLKNLFISIKHKLELFLDKLI